MKRPKNSPNQQIKLDISEEASHAISVHDYPDLELDENEYVVIDVERSKILPVSMHMLAILSYIFFSVIAFLDMNLIIETFFVGFYSGISFLTTILLAIVCYVTVWIYNRNKMIVSNLRIFSKTQSSLFSHRTQSIELEHIEDLSYSQTGILANLFDYGTIRFSTVGNQYTYELKYISNPKKQTSIIEKDVHNLEASKIDETEEAN